MTVRDGDLSRAVSHALRHEPWLYELELDEEGWVPVEQLLAALRRQGGDWPAVDRGALERMLETSTKRRHELDGQRIRALYGHSLPGRIRKRPDTPPAQLFHGTAPRTWDVVEVDGLSPMGRQFVHLSADRGTAVAVGRRKSADPVVLSIDATAASSAGVAFYAGNDHVWLADHVPARFITPAG
ncbi:RNA 2'-phosphotransferase [Prauserella alba]|uniref:Probable RNA 2'-phosphotransferase n=1 Tax=Prauserella alba TaxID=176898 RepID=A0ABP4FT17_9PSEU|nr:RNA 2'-phosphotransferase [Prauserella alba]MCP2180063.1 putative RNA 2'-phosphotransferase [Prauserella alba]